MVKLYEELVKLCTVCMQNTIQGEGFGGGGSFTLPGCGLWIYEGLQANGLGRGTEMEQVNSLPGRRGFHY